MEPVKVPGATITSPTGHNADYLLEHGIGPGAVIEVHRAGDVIPKHLKTIERVHVDLPTLCPCCGCSIVKDGPIMKCPNDLCPDRVKQRLEHFFFTMGNVDEFGPVAIERFYDGCCMTVSQIYHTVEDGHLSRLGFGPGEAQNLKEQRERSLKQPIPDWRFVGALGVPGLGTGDAKKILRHYKLSEIRAWTKPAIKALEGFGDIKANKIIDGLTEMDSEIAELLNMGFNLEITKSLDDVQSPIKGKGICFTGTMQTGGRKEFEKHAVELGAKVQSSVSSKTAYLVYGAKLGATKRAAAEKHGTKCLTEVEYVNLIGE